MSPLRLADLVLVAHFAFVLFVLAGLPLILLGARHWHWIRNRTFRLVHAGAILFVAAESLLGIACPLTDWENALRGTGSTQSFIGHWLSRLLYYPFAEWVFTVAYCAFAGAVAYAWFAVPPRPGSRQSGPGGRDTLPSAEGEPPPRPR
jgi:hypothetical protein